MTCVQAGVGEGEGGCAETGMAAWALVGQAVRLQFVYIHPMDAREPREVWDTVHVLEQLPMVLQTFLEQAEHHLPNYWC